MQRAAYSLLGINEFAAFCETLPPHTPLTGSSILLNGLKVKVEWSGLSADEIPEEGQPLLVVANHPFGLVEALALDVLLLARRSDVTFLAYYFIGELPGIEGRYIYVDPMRDPQHRKRNTEAWRQSYQWLAKGGLLGVFPAGRVAHIDWTRMAIADPPWNPHIGRVVLKAKVPVLPVFFHGRNSLAFQLAALVLPKLHQSLVVREINNKHGITLRGVVGNIIRPDEMAGFTTGEETIGFLRDRTEALAHPSPAS